jgi:hypothetical protein
MVTLLVYLKANKHSNPTRIGGGFRGIFEMLSVNSFNALEH